MQTNIVNFLWVASAYDNPGQPAFQVAVVDTAESFEEAQAIGGMTRLREALNVTQATEAGITLEAIGAAINADLAMHNQNLDEQLAAVTAERDGLAADLADARKQIRRVG